MAYSVIDLIVELKKFDENKKIRVLYGRQLPILWVSHNEYNFEDEGCVLVTCKNIEKDIPKKDRFETVGDLLWYLQFFKHDSLVWNNVLHTVKSPIKEVSDEIKDENGDIISDTVFLITFAHTIGL